MKSKFVTIVGVGALGSHTALLLRNIDASLVFIDYDRVEMKNTQSQFHGKTHAGKLKVHSLQQTMNLLFGLKPLVNSNKLVEDNVDSLLGGAELIIDALDNKTGRDIVSGFTRKTGVPCLHGALDANGSYGRVAWDEKFVPDAEGALGQATCENGEALPFISVTASYLAYAAQEFLKTGKKVGFEISPGGAIRT